MARKYQHFQKRISKLGPGFMGCNERQSSCTRRDAQPRKGCPNCEFTIQNKLFKQELESELRRLKRGTWKGANKWPSKKLLDLVVQVGSLANSIEGLNPRWPVVTATLVGVYREEQGKIRVVDDWNLTNTKVNQAEENAAKVRKMAQDATSKQVIPNTRDRDPEWEFD